ncbi:MAG: hemerythrin family protein [Spirochaetes bacterium]|nr:hemerythrin family protein [Spirochaetota bacterium]
MLITPDEKKKSEAHAVALNHNLFIVWNPEYNLGIPILDEHHRGIITTINSLHFGIQQNYIKNMLMPIVDMIYDYTQVHFQTEEDFFEKIGFPEAKQHTELHRKLSAELSSIGRKSVLDRDSYHFIEFLKRWWIDHICKEDLVHKNYLLNHPHIHELQAKAGQTGKH